MAKKNILCVVGSRNQTSQLHQISQHLSGDYEFHFTQIFGEGFAFKMVAEAGLFDNTVLGTESSFTKASQQYIKINSLNYDYRGNSKGIQYDLAILSTDLIVPKSFKKIKTVWVQEGMIDPINNWAKTVKRLKLPPYLPANTALNGTSNFADIYCSMSEGYRNYFNKYGTERDRILVTGVPNFDDIQTFMQTIYPEDGFVLVATSDIRELGGNEDRSDFIQQCVKIADGKKIIFKPHPNENIERVRSEIFAQIPDATIITDPIIDTLIAHCDTLITQFSSCVYNGLILGKKIYSYFPIEELEGNKPIQNGGKSSKIIADIVQEFIEYDGERSQFIGQSRLAKSYL